MALELALVSFHGQGGAASAYGAMKDRARSEQPWMLELGFVEHHHNDHLALRGTFAGHYVDVDEGDHISESGAGTGAIVGALLGSILGPAGIASGFALGGTIGSRVGEPSEHEEEPQALVDRLRAAVPPSTSAIVMIAEPGDVEQLLAALGEDAGGAVRQQLTSDQIDALETSLGSAPPPSRGPSTEGEASTAS
jgi:uncharacterized membrane protein